MANELRDLASLGTLRINILRVPERVIHPRFVSEKFKVNHLKQIQK